MIEYHYADVIPDGRVRACFTYLGPEEGPPEPHWESQAEGQIILLDKPVDWRGPTETSVLYMVDGAFEWRELLPLPDTIARAILQIDEAANALRMRVISQQTNLPEYQRVEPEARSFAAAGYPDSDVPRGVASWASAKHRDNWTARDAADDIIRTADAWIDLLESIRDLRLHAKEDVRHAADCAEVATRVQQFSTDLTELMEGSK